MKYVIGFSLVNVEMVVPIFFVRYVMRFRLVCDENEIVAHFS